MRTTWKKLGLVMLCVTIATISWANSEHKDTEDIQKFTKDASLENGKQIYLSGQNINGQRIPFEKGPHWMSMHGGSCVTCHGEQGKGGSSPMMCRRKAPAITYKALAGEEHGHEEGEPQEDTDEHGHEPYTISSLHKVLEEGINPAGKKLDSCMPRWKLSDEDFRDLVAYLMDLDELSDEQAHDEEKHSEPHQ